MKSALYACAALVVVAGTACSKGGSSGGNTQSKQPYVSTVAGNGTGGFADGSSSNAMFNHPFGIAFDGSGNLVIGDEGNNRIRLISAGGDVTTLAGQTPGYLDGSGSNAKFNNPEGVTVDGSGNIYVSDALNNRIREVTSGGSVTTLAGDNEGYTDGSGQGAQFYYPEGLLIDPSGNLLVADSYNNRIRQVTLAGSVTTLAGSGPTGPGNGGDADGSTGSAMFKAPFGVAMDPSGNIYIADQNNNCIRVISGGKVSTIAGNGSTGLQDGAVASAEFAAPEGVAVDANGDIFVADAGNDAIREIRNGQVTTIAGGGSAGYTDGLGSQAQLNHPAQIILDASGDLYFTDQGNHVIRKIIFK